MIRVRPPARHGATSPTSNVTVTSPPASVRCARSTLPTSQCVLPGPLLTLAACASLATSTKRRCSASGGMAGHRPSSSRANWGAHSDMLRRAAHGAQHTQPASGHARARPGSEVWPRAPAAPPGRAHPAARSSPQLAAPMSRCPEARVQLGVHRPRHASLSWQPRPGVEPGEASETAGNTKGVATGNSARASTCAIPPPPPCSTAKAAHLQPVPSTRGSRPHPCKRSLAVLHFPR